MQTQVGKTIKEARRKKGWSQAALAKKAGCSEKTIARIEQGEPSNVRSLLEIGKALGLPPNQLVDDDSGRPVARRRPLRRMHDGQECIQLISDYNFRWSRVRIQQDPGEQLHTAISKVCEAVDVIRQHEHEFKVPALAQYEAGRKIAQAIPELEAHGWLLELEEGEQEVHGYDHDSELYWTVHLRPQADSDRRANPERSGRS